MVHLDLDCVTFFLLFFPAFWYILALLCVLRVAGFLELRSTDLGIFSRAFLGGFGVASLSWFLPALFRVLRLALLAVLVVALLILLCVTLLPFTGLAELFIFSLTLGDVFSLAGGVVLGLALVLVLLHAHLFMGSFAVRRCDIFPLEMTLWLLELLLKVVPDSCKKACTGWC